MPFTVVEVSATPNPLAKKFTLDQAISDEPRSYFAADAAVGDPLAAALFAIEGVAGVLILHNFVTVNKAESAAWPGIVAKVKAVLKKAV